MRPLRSPSWLLLLALAGCGEAARRDPLFESEAQDLVTPLALPAASGNGLAVKTVCQNQAADGTCSLSGLGIGTTLDTVAEAVVALNAPAPAAAVASKAAVFSWVQPGPVDYTDFKTASGDTRGLFGTNYDVRAWFPNGEAHQTPFSFAGWLAITGAGPVTKTFTIGSDDGAALAVSNGTQLFTCRQDTVRSFGYGCTPAAATNPQPPANQTLTVTFPGPGLYPIELVFFESGGQQGVELAWADGTVASNPAAGNLRGFSAIPQASLYAPDVRASMWVENASSAGAVVAAGTSLRYTAAITNFGPVAASGLKFSVVVPTATLGSLASSSSGCSVATAGGNATLTCTGINLAAGATSNLVFTATVPAGAAADTAIDLQGVVQGLATSTDFSTGGTPAIGDTSQIWVLTDDAAAQAPLNTTETGNAPSTMTGIGAGLSDDDATRVTVGLATPQAPAVTGPTGSLTSAAATVVSGTSGYAAGLQIKVTLTSGGTTQTCFATVQTGGGWSCAALALDAGSWSAVAALVNPAGLTGLPSAAFVFTLNPPPVPVLTGPADGGVLRTQPTFVSGTSAAPAGAVVKVTASGAGGPQVCNATVQADHSWVCSLSLADGGYSVSAATLSVTGAPGTSSATRSFTVNTAGLPAPLVNQTAALSQNQRPTLGGTASASTLGAGYKLIVYDGASPICTVNPLSASPWSCTPAANLADGTHVVTAVVFDSAGNSSPASNPDVFVVDTTKPAAPALAAIATPTNNQKPVFSGTGEPGASVAVKDGSTTLCSATVQSNGSWSCTPASNLAERAYTGVTAVQTDAAGNVSNASTGIDFTIDVTPPAAPSVASFPAQPIASSTPTISGTAVAGTSLVVRDQAGRVLCSFASVAASWSCTSPALPDGTTTVTAASTDAAGNSSSSAPRSVIVDTVPPAAPALAQTATPGSTLRPVFSGTAEPGVTVIVSEGGVTLCSATAQASGVFSCQSTVDLTGAPTTHTVVAKAQDGAGNLSAASNGDVFVVDTRTPPAPGLDPVAPSAGGQPGTTATTQPVFSGTGAAGDLITVRTEPDGAVLCTAVVNAQGTWACTTSASAALTGSPATSYTVVAVQTSPAGVTSGVSGSQSFTVTTGAPAQPSIDPLPAAIAGATPQLSGAADAGTTVVVRDETGRVICTVQPVPANGHWACTAAALHEGTTSLTAVSTGPSGLSAPPSSPVSTSVDTLAPLPPSLQQTPSPRADTLPVFTGAAEPGSQVAIFADGGSTPVAVCTTGSDGVFQCAASVPLTGAPAVHTVRAVATDAAGNASAPSNADTFTVDTRAPSAPTLSAQPTPPGGQPGTTGSTQPVFSGTGTAGDTVTVSASAPSAQTLCTATVRADGTWSCQSAVALIGQPATSYTIAATQTSPAGVTSPASAPQVLTVDTSAPSAPTLTGPGAPSGSATVQLSGTAADGSTIEVRDATGRVVCSAGPVSGGSWSCSAGPLPDGTSSLTAVATGPGGIASGASAAISVTVDTLAPAAPQLSQTATPGSNPLPVFTGSAEPGSTVRIFDGASASPVATCTADVRGLFSCAASVPLAGAPATHDCTATATDAAGNVSAPSNTDSFVVDTRLPPAPTLDALPTPANGQPGFTSNPQPVFSGTGSAGDTVTVQSDQPGAAVLCTAVVRADGTWSCQSAVVLTGQPATTYGVTAVQTTPAGVTSGASQTEQVTVSTAPPAPPTLNPPPSPIGTGTPTLGGTGTAGDTIVVTDGTGHTVCTAQVQPDGTWSCTASTLPDGGGTLTATDVGPSGVSSSGSAPAPIVVDTVPPPAPLLSQTPSPLGTTHPTFFGTAEPGSTVAVSEGGVVLCTAVAAGDGSFHCTSAPEVTGAPQQHSVTATATDAAQNHSQPSQPDVFTVDTRTPAAPVIDLAPAPAGGQPGTTTDPHPVITGTGAAGNTVTVSTGGQLLCTALVASDGTWRCTSVPALPGDPPAATTLSATQTSPAGVTGPAGTQQLIVDTRTPAAPTLDAPATPSGDPRPSFGGTGQPGATVTLADAYGRPICTALVAADGRWTCRPAAPLADGDYMLQAFQTSPGGRASGQSAAAPFSLRTMLTPVLDQPASPTREGQPALHGTGTPGRTVVVYSGQAPLCSALVAADGSWTCTPASPLPSGTYVLSAAQTDGGGRFSAATAQRVLVVDRDAPAAPVLDAPASPTEETQPLITGTAEAGSLVTVRGAGGAVLCTATATAAGTFACKPAQPLPLGPTTFTADAADALGNTSAASEPQTVVVRAPKAAPEVAITGPSDGAQLEGVARPQITGTSTPGSSVEVTLDGITYEAQAASDGSWTLVVPTDLEAGPHTVKAVAVDERGVRSPVVQVSFTLAQKLFARGGCASGGVPAPALAVLALVWFLRRRRPALAAVRAQRVGKGAVVAFALALASGAAQAQQSTDVELFHPAAGGDGYAGVEGARPLVTGDQKFEVKLWGGTSVDPLVTRDPQGTRQVVISNRIASWLDASFHVWDNFSVAAQLPVVLAQQGDPAVLGASQGAGLSLAGGIGDLRVTPRWALLRQPDAGVDLAMQVSIDLPTGNAAKMSGTGRFGGEGLLALGRRFYTPGAAFFEVVGNGYLRLRPPAQILDVKIGNELGLRAALGYFPSAGSKAIPQKFFVEGEGRTWMRGGFATGTAPAEWRAGATWCLGRGFAVDLAGGTALGSGVGSPKARFLLGLGFAPEACRPSDRDGDGIADSVDKCPGQPGVAANGGCPALSDADGDGVPDAEDSCPAVAGPKENRGCPAGHDRDGDGIADLDDKCPDVAGPKENQGCPIFVKPVEAVACVAPPAPVPEAQKIADLPLVVDVAPPPLVVSLAAPPPDRDGDGVPDAEDNCPDKAGPKENQGCPKTVKQLVVIKGDKIDILDKVYFASSKAVIDKRSFALLDQVAAVLKSHPELLRIEVQGHTDNVGDEQKNLRLSQARAEAVVVYLIKAGIGFTRLAAKGYGSGQPVVPNTSKANKEKNRRVEFHVLEVQQKVVEVEAPAKS